MHQIENEYLKVKVRNYGAELTSVFSKKNNIEHLWQADEKVWGWHAPVLFPVIGRCLNDEITIEGKAYKMEKHGFARKSDFKLLELGQGKMVFLLTDSEETLKVYPYKFEFLIGYRLSGNELHVSFEVINKDENSIYFQLGGHPAFAVPFNEGEKYEDYHLDFEMNENSSRHFIDSNGYFDGRTEKVFDNSNSILLRGDLFKDDALIFKDLKSRKVNITSKGNLYSLSVDFSGFNYLGLWAKENAPYICVEPWIGCADTAHNPVEFSSKESVVMLKHNEKFNSSFVIKVS